MYIMRACRTWIHIKHNIGRHLLPQTGRRPLPASLNTASWRTGAFSSGSSLVLCVFYIETVTGTKEVEWKRLGQQATGEDRDTVMCARQDWTRATAHLSTSCGGGHADSHTHQPNRRSVLRTQRLTVSLLKIPRPSGLPENYKGGVKAIFKELGKPSTSVVIEQTSFKSRGSWGTTVTGVPRGCKRWKLLK